MDKYEFNIKVEQIKKLVNKGDFETAMKIADTIDWRRVRSTSLLTMISQIYEKNAEYQDAKDILLLAYERAPLGKGLLYKLTDLALRENNIQEAEAYYREFCELSGDDPRQYLLRFLILEAKDAPLEQQINSLERYCQEELDEKWLYHLAELYHQANQADDCVRICDKIMLMFGLGKYVDKAMELKLQYAPLTKYQMDLVENREKYEEKLRAVEEEYKNGTYRKPEPEGEYLDTDEPEAELDDEPENEPEGQPEQAEPEEKAGKPKAETKPADEKVEKAALDEDVVASLHEAQAEEALAKEVSKIKPYDEEEGASEGETRVFRNLRDLEPAEAEEKSEEAPIHEFEEEEETIVEDWDFEPEEEEEEIKESNHLMIEAEDPAAGLAMALDSLKKIHRELGTKHPVAKISGANLSHRGIASVAERLAGKDLVVEHAADLDDLTVEELEELMTQDETGMVVVLIDTQARLEQMHRAYPALAERFQYIGCENQKDDAAKLAQAREEELKRQQAQQEAGDVVVLPIGKRSAEYFVHHEVPLFTQEVLLAADIAVGECFQLARRITEGYCKGEYDAVKICYTRFDSMMTQTASTMEVLPLTMEPTEEQKAQARRSQILYKPSSEEVFRAIIPEYVAGIVYGAVCESVASELAARRTAMDAATKNAGEMIDHLNLYYNRARQAAITQEITEIVAGAEI